MSVIHSALPSRGRVPRPAGPHHRVGRRILTGSTSVVLSFAALLPFAAPAAAATPTYLGAVGDVAGLARNTGAPVATHAYAQFSGSVPTARMITVRANGSSWRAVANAGPGSALYDDITRWADTIKGRTGPIMFAYNHEPEASASNSYGTAADFIAAYRHVVTIFRQRGVQNVEFTWQMTEYAFRVSSSDARYAAKWYPGDAYVDNVGADAYNWFDCGHGTGKWVELSTMADPVLAFARAHGKHASLPEFASDPNSRRASWLQNAHQYFLAHQDVLTAAFYFNRGPTNPANQDCSWNLTTRPEFDAYGSMAKDSAHFRA
jgi:hypothetical protein